MLELARSAIHQASDPVWGRWTLALVLSIRVYGFVAAAVKLAQATLGMRYRRSDGRGPTAGPTHYLADDLPNLVGLIGLSAVVAPMLRGDRVESGG